MIFYFSGTGNSLYVAKNIAEHNKEKLISISSAINSGDEVYEYCLSDNEVLGFVFPVYAWGPPKMVLDFIDKLSLVNYRGNYTFSVATCGSNIGNTMKVLKNCLNEKGLDLNNGFSIAMPNNYIIVGDVDTKEKEKEKLDAAIETLGNINKIIIDRTTGIFNIEKGIFPWLLTGVINPMFNKKAIDTSHFYSNESCTGCGICEKVCNCNNIKVNERPVWGNKCTQCLACVHYCPVNASQYGKSTHKKGRYTNPNIRIEEIMK